MAGRGSAGRRVVGVNLADRIYAGLMADDQMTGELVTFPAEAEPGDDDMHALVEMHTDALVEGICTAVVEAANGLLRDLEAVGVALPGLVRNGVVEEAPNLPQLKGARIQERVSAALLSRGCAATVVVLNDADAMAAGLALLHGKLDHMIRVWTLGTGIGFGCYPFSPGVWEAGHSVVTLDERENFCGCGGRGHLEGIMGHRAMRLRFLDMEPEEVFEAATRRELPDPRCVEFRHLWHKALAAATASSIHLSGAGKFFVTGYNVRFLDLNLLRHYLNEMVKMSPLQSYQVEIVKDEQQTRVLGAAVSAECQLRSAPMVAEV